MTVGDGIGAIRGLRIGAVGTIGSVGTFGAIGAVGALAVLGVGGLLLGDGNGHTRHARCLGIVADLFAVLGDRDVGRLGRSDFNRRLGRVLLLKGAGRLGAIDRLTVDLDFYPRGLALGNRDLDLRNLVFALLGRLLSGFRISRLVRALIGIFVLIGRYGLLGRLLGSMQSPITNFARVLNQIAEKNGEGAEAPAEA